MKLDEALTLRMSFNDLCGEIRVDENGYICLNDLAQYFPHRRIDKWRKSDQTNDFILVVDKFLNGGDSRHLYDPLNGSSTNTTKRGELKSIISKRGKYNGGTYAHELVAMEFCAWLSPEFKLKVYLEYVGGRQQKKDWNVKRILAAYNYKIMSKSVEDAHDPAKFYHYSNEAKMLNKIVFGKHEKEIRETATEGQLDDIAWLESKNSAFIDIEMNYQDRKDKLSELFSRRTAERNKQIDL